MTHILSEDDVLDHSLYTKTNYPDFDCEKCQSSKRCHHLYSKRELIFLKMLNFFNQNRPLNTYFLSTVNNHLVYNHANSISKPGQIDMTKFSSFILSLPDLSQMDEFNREFLKRARKDRRLPSLPLPLATFLLNMFLFHNLPNSQSNSKVSFKIKTQQTHHIAKNISIFRSIFQIHFQRLFGSECFPQDLGLFGPLLSFCADVASNLKPDKILSLEPSLEFLSNFTCLMYGIKKKRVLEDMKGFFLKNSEQIFRAQGLLSLVQSILKSPPQVTFQDLMDPHLT